MSIPSAARRDAIADFFPGRPQPKDYRYPDHDYYKGCYDLEWRRLEAEAGINEAIEKERIRSTQTPTLEERVETLEEQVAELTRSLGL